MTREQAQAILDRRISLSNTKRESLSTAKHSRGQDWFTPLPLVRGAVAELLVSADLMAGGCQVFINMNPTGSCDLVAEMRDGQLVRVEVKTGVRANGGRPMVELVRQKGKFDLLAVVAPDKAISYFTPELEPVEALGFQPDLKRLGSGGMVTEIDSQA